MTQAVQPQSSCPLPGSADGEVICRGRPAEATAAGTSPLQEQRGAGITELLSEPLDVAVSFCLSDLCCGSRELPDLCPGVVQHWVFLLFSAGFFPSSSGIFAEGSDWNNPVWSPGTLGTQAFCFYEVTFAECPKQKS